MVSLSDRQKFIIEATIAVAGVLVAIWVASSQARATASARTAAEVDQKFEKIDSKLDSTMDLIRINHLDTVQRLSVVETEVRIIKERSDK